MSQYHIYQTNAEYSFRGWQDTKSKFEINDYKKVYSGELVDMLRFNGKDIPCNTNDNEVLEDLYVKFNINRPSDFTGHSLSVSDIVEIVRKDETKYYYCNDFGWTDISSQIPKEQQ